MKTLPINNKVIGVVENYPDYAEAPWIINPGTERVGVNWYDPNRTFGEEGFTYSEGVSLPAWSNRRILGRASEITEEQAREIVEVVAWLMYKDYTDDENCYEEALESFQSFCKANQIKETDLILIQAGKGV